MASFVILRCFNLILLIISIAYCNISSSINHEFDNNTNEIDLLGREKRQITNLFIHHRGDLQHSTQIHAQLSTKSLCSYKSIDVTCLSNAHYPTFDGSCNNLLNSWWGTTNIPFRHLIKANYTDGEFSRNFSFTGILLPTPPEISNVCSNEIVNSIEHSINSFFTLFAQFIDHDFSSAANGKDDENKQIICHCQEEIKKSILFKYPNI